MTATEETSSSPNGRRTTTAVHSRDAAGWAQVCRLDQLVPGRGAAAKVDGRQVALIRWYDDDVVYAIDNRDPFSGAHVMSRGIVGDKAGIPKVASPIFKQSFDLGTGQCLDDDRVTLTTFPVRVTDEGWVEIEVEVEASK